MKWTTGLSRGDNTSQAFGEAADRLDFESEGQVDVLVVFFTEHHREQAEALSLAAAGRFPDAVCIGCSATGVVAGSDEVEQGPALSLIAGSAPGVEVRPVRLEPDIHDSEGFDWERHTPLGELARPHLLTFADVRTFDAEQMLQSLDERYPATERFGALIGGANADDVTLLEGHVFEDGGVGLALSGDLSVETMVAQSARPIGEPLIVTSHTQNVVHEFDQGNPMDVFRRTVSGLNEEDRVRAKHSMLVGIGLDGDSSDYGRGDFLLRNIAGFNPEAGDMAVAAPIEDLEVLQFHLMNPTTALEELERGLDDYTEAHPGGEDNRAVFYFSCLERGEEFFGRPNCEPRLICQELDNPPLGGCLSDGEIGPLGDHTYLHGYASVVTVISKNG